MRKKENFGGRTGAVGGYDVTFAPSIPAPFVYILGSAAYRHAYRALLFAGSVL